MIGNSCAWHRGKVIGGTFVVNGMLYVRGSKEDYNEWYRQGNPGKSKTFKFYGSIAYLGVVYFDQFWGAVHQKVCQKIYFLHANAIFSLFSYYFEAKKEKKGGKLHTGKSCFKPKIWSNTL